MRGLPWLADRLSASHGPWSKFSGLCIICRPVRIFISSFNTLCWIWIEPAGCIIQQGFSTCFITGYCYGVVSYKASHALRPFSDLLCVPVWILIVPDSSTRALWQQPAETSSSEEGRNMARNDSEFADEDCLSYFAAFFNVPYAVKS
jgi:hypothetical protein